MPNLIGRSPNQVPVNGMLGTAAFVDIGQLSQYTQAGTGLIPIVSLTPTAVVNLDFLTLFTSQYDNYLIIGEGIKFAADDGVSLRVAVAGAVDTGSNYHNMNPAGGTSTATTSLAVTSAATVRTAGTGSTFYVNIRNTNDSTVAKMIESQAVWNSTVAGPVFTSSPALSAHATAVLTGFRLYSVLGNNFAAQGRIRVFGYNNV